MLSIAALAIALPQARAQVRLPATAAESTAVVDTTDLVADIIRRGSKLEDETRWGEALTFYEDALREHPQNPALQQRRQLARTQYDLGRRYADSSYRKLVITTGEREALDLYNELLTKVETHYVHTPDWASLVVRGQSTLQLALGRQEFARRYLRDVPPERIEAFRRDLRATLAARTIRTRQDAVTAAGAAAQLADRRLRIPPSAVVLEYIAAAATALDNYSAFLTGDQLDEVYSQIEGNFVGLGIELKADNGTLLIVSVIEGSPAAGGGLRAGDRIVGVDRRTTDTMTTDQAASLLQGPEGSWVELLLADPQDRRRQVRLRRQHVDVPSIQDMKIVDREAGIAYLRLTSFQKSTGKDLDAALWKLHGQGMRSLVLDLRGNPGGLLTAAVDAVDKFVEDGSVVSTRGRNVGERLNYTAHREGTWRVPLVVLIDDQSASASEIFAGAIRDYRRGTIVGTRSYGKGSVQGIFPLHTANAGIRLTTAKFYSPKGLPFSDVGVTPDVVVHRAAKPASDGSVEVRIRGQQQQDTMLDAAVQVARRQVAKR